jgi:hypothetical protein
VVTIRWDNSRSLGVTRVCIYVSRVTPKDWEVIGPDAPNTGQYDWTVTGPPTAHARICVIDQSGRVGTDTSQLFTIGDVATPTMVSEFAATPSEHGIHLTWRTESVTTISAERAIATTGPWSPVAAEPHTTSSGTTEVVDADVDPGAAYWYRLVWTTATGTTTFGPISAQAALPREFAIARVWPNPCGAALNVELDVARPGRVVLGLVDLAGREVQRLADRDVPAGHLSIAWNSGNAHAVPPGVYFLHYDAGGRRMIRRVVVID